MFSLLILLYTFLKLVSGSVDNLPYGMTENVKVVKRATVANFSMEDISACVKILWGSGK